MTNSSRPKLTILMGAGATMAAGMPSVSEITATLEELRDDNSRMYDGKPFFVSLKEILVNDGHFENVNFETLLHATEMLQPVLTGPSVLPTTDYFRSVLPAFLEPKGSIKKLFSAGSLGYWRDQAFYHIARLISDRLKLSNIKEKHLTEFLMPLHERFDLKVFTLNYDDLIDRVDLPWRDGFVSNSSNFYEQFEPKQFIADDESTQPLLVHLHGSTRFGYCQDGIVDIHKYGNPDRAINYMRNKGFTQSVHGRLISAGPIISGLGKIDQLMFRPSPYGYYFKSFIDNLIKSERLLILGYGGWDRHINEWLSQFLAIHGTSSRLAHLGNISNTALRDRLISLSPDASMAQGKTMHYGPTLILEPAKFPFMDKNIELMVSQFLQSK